MSNIEILESELALREMDTDTPLFTYHEWLKRGYQVKKGGKAAIQTMIWKYTKKKDKEGKETEKAIMVKGSFFTIGQVEKVKGEQK